MRRKAQPAKKPSISMPPVLFDAATTTVERDGYPSLSAYVQELIRRDQAERRKLALAS